MTTKNNSTIVAHSIFAAITAFAVLTVLTGCERGQTLSEIEERERSTRLYSNAVDDLQAGRVDMAIKGFKAVVRQEPKSYSAHFQLATLLQDYQKDYVSAIFHYREYLDLRPASDKATVATDRLKLCERLLSAEVIRKVGGSVSEQLKKDNVKLTEERDALVKNLKVLQASFAATNQALARVSAENDMKKKLLDRLTADDGRAAPTTAASALAELKKIEAEDKRKRINPTDNELLDEEASDTPTPVDDRIRNSADVKRLRQQLAKDEKADAVRPEARPAQASKTKQPNQLDSIFGGGAKKPKESAGQQRPSTYTVQEGDTLYKISERFYGSSRMWRRIREANKTTISTDGRVRTGQVLTLP